MAKKKGRRTTPSRNKAQEQETVAVNDGYLAASAEDADENDHVEMFLGPARWSMVTGETSLTLRDKWKVRTKAEDIIAFYSDWKGKPWREFSNFYQHKNHGFVFVLPLELLDIAETSSGEDPTYELFAKEVYCDFSEKAIMLCKAAVMGDARSYALIATAETPQEAKRLGRKVSSWDAERWSLVVCGVALTVLKQKFMVPELKKVLLSTGEKTLCEATAQDNTWAIGISIKMPKIYSVPARWRGSNILGWALMETRAWIRSEAARQGETGFEFHPTALV